MTNPSTKRCSRCREELPVAAFNRAKASRDGRASICRRCASLSRQSTKPRRKNAIRAAIKAGDIDAVRALLPGSRYTLDQMLAMAVQDYNTARKHGGHEKIVDLLLAKGAQPHWSLLFEPARTGSHALAERLIAGGAELNIFACAAAGDLARIRKLLKRDAGFARSTTPQETRAYRGFTPLHFCCMSALGRSSAVRAGQFLEIGTLLVDCGADVHATGIFYGTLPVTPLDMAAHTGGNVRLIEFLIDRGAGISSFALGEALSHRGRSLEDGFALAELFLQRGLDINAPHPEGTFLHRAANAGNPEIVRWLLEHGANVNAPGRMGRTPLHLAAERNVSPRIAQLLVQYGARLDAKDDSGLTARDVARQHGRTRVENWLAGAVVIK